MNGFSHFNQILLNLFDVLNTFHASISVGLYRLTHIRFNLS